jgi:Plasmid pRiA4b ORF-3-like protein
MCNTWLMDQQDPSVNHPIAPVARLKITLDRSKPMIVRRIEVPLTSTLHTLHEAIQAVMLLENYHLFRFDNRCLLEPIGFIPPAEAEKTVTP